ncbi:hypothetical protein A5742_14105 [Mycolicibacterium fortuitum]|uniref:DUF998 domain-containing protein n=1 Tax=Mycolicibacterium fortuitum TaxID=1766 RepID=A0ABD6QD79_MYCFO|nr:hypothetical protein [Mycolicibacterium fortuitum]OMC34251.1 hypothetical protein A5742_14105 [Mycolicibacterium fortuitum]
MKRKFADSGTVPSALALTSFGVFLLGAAAAAALERTDAYRFQVIATAPCTKRVLELAAFETSLWWIALGGLSTAVVGSLVVLVLPRVNREFRVHRGVYLLLVTAAVLLAFSLAAHSHPIDFSDSTLPTCGAASGQVLR